MSAAQDLIRRHRLSVSDYHRMGEAEIFVPGVRVELIEGEIVDMSPIGSKHADMVRRMTRLFYAAIGEQAIVSVQNPIILPQNSEPEPDIALLRPPEDLYSESHPRAEDVLLIAEVADTSLRYDREIKVPLYAKHDIPEVWLIDITSKRFTVFHTPGDGSYRQENELEVVRWLAPTQMTDITVDLSSLF